MKGSEGSTTARRLGKIALLGFALAPLLPGKARAYYAAGFAILGLTTTSGVGTTVGAVFLGIKLSQKDNDRKEDRDDMAVGELTRALIDSALLGAEGDLAMHLRLLGESPSAFHQLTLDAESGGGPALDALASSTHLAPATVAARWLEAVAAAGPVNDESGAARATSEFLRRVAPDLSVPDQAVATFVWELVRERAAPTFPADADYHARLAAWLGVPADAVASASTALLDRLATSDEAALRAAVYASPDAWLDQVAIQIETEHLAEILVRTQALQAEVAVADAGVDTSAR